MARTAQPARSTAGGLRGELRTVRHMLFPRTRGTTAAERMESYYGPTAHVYDAFRADDRLLHGRRALMRMLPLSPGDRLIDLGGGTGANIEHLEGSARSACSRITVVDVSPSMLRVARGRIERHGWRNVEAVAGDATCYRPPDGTEPADVVVFSYVLTMVPDWFAAVERADALLRPGGTLAVCDFHVARRRPAPGMARHALWRRHLWPLWFAHNDVYLSPDHLPFLRARFETVHLSERLARVAYLPARVPHYLFLGRKPTAVPTPAPSPSP
ncbi:class I SAM-dependent methyltransferase [Streptomyces sp. NPDC048337]|uniref:class I SAM-dependent methyltransferase n=1 Tax=Streptomyces sp. NPDC048337 TaxID=3365535 RepID=UPI0037103F77